MLDVSQLIEQAILTSEMLQVSIVTIWQEGYGVRASYEHDENADLSSPDWLCRRRIRSRATFGERIRCDNKLFDLDLRIHLVLVSRHR